MGIMRMGYAHVRVTDMTEAKNHYASTLGLYETLEDTSPEGNKRVFYKGWDEWDHHSLVLEEGGIGVVKYGWKVQHEADIDAIEKKAQTFGLTVERMSKGENPEVGDGIRFTTTSDHVFEVYHSQTAIGTEVGTHNPDPLPRGRQLQPRVLHRAQGRRHADRSHRRGRLLTARRGVHVTSSIGGPPGLLWHREMSLLIQRAALCLRGEQP